MRTGRRLPTPPAARRSVAAKPPGRPSALLRLQGAAGNRATTRLVQRQARKGFAGVKLGRNRAGQEVEVERELGTLGGYEDRLQAIAVARLARADPAAVGCDDKGRWHAFLLNRDFHGAKYTPSAGSPLFVVYGLPSRSGIAAQEATVANLKAHTGDVAAKLNAATRDLYALILGVDGAEVLVNRSSFDRKAGKINVNPGLVKSGKLGTHGRESQQHERFEPGAPSAFEISPSALASPARAQAVLFHEVSHMKDYELTQRWVTKAGNIFVRGGGDAQSIFDDWVRKRTSAAEARLVSDIASGVEATTEARAYIRTFIAAFDVGEDAEAALQLVTYAKGMAEGRIAIPTQEDHNPVVLELKAELAAYGKRLDRARRTAFDAALAVAAKENRRSWLAGIKRR